MSIRPVDAAMLERPEYVGGQRPRLLDLFSGGGGAAMGYYRAGFDVTGVDVRPQPKYPFPFIQHDAMTFPLDEFDVVHASPPCQLYTRKTSTWGRKRTHHIEHPDLLAPTWERLSETGLLYVIENVVGAPMDPQLVLCGTMLGLNIQKHRWFIGNWQMPPAPGLCRHQGTYNQWQGKGRSSDKLREAMDLHWLPADGGAGRKAGVTGDVSNAIPPRYTEYIGGHLMVAFEESL